MNNSILQKSSEVELSLDEFKSLITNLDKSPKDNQKAMIFKFGATWCKPCQVIKEQCNSYFSQMPSSVKCYNIDIDENIELYSFLKTKRMINGVPTLLGYINRSNRETNQWHISDISVCGSNSTNIDIFFQRINNY
jgi:thiol-disulfide isomerase/thioredoxin